ncbi:MAG: DUF1194 domain-containing protein [Pikeienuella sp.]|uniref:DUF1194 domain-containing protein n=1 Tax=Pikeienuella sp. TaxID=2831957 RepID=UPI00391A6BFD
MIRALAVAGALLLPGLAPGTAAAQEPCAVALVLAMDVSRSVSSREYRLQMDGLAAAFRDEEVLETIRAQQGGVLATVTIWGDRTQQRQTTDWTLLLGGEETLAFADSVAATQRYFGFTLTGLGAAMAHAAALLEAAPQRCRRQVIDISGDGVSNDGPRPNLVRDALPAGVTVNGLVILGATPDPKQHYIDEVIAGPGAFVETAADFEDYARAIRLKLLRELAPALSMLSE